MAVFQFSLAAVLRVREHARNERRWELRAMTEVRQRMEAEIRALQNELSRASEKLAPEDGAIFTAVELQLLGEHAQRLGQRIRDKQLELEKFERQLVAKRAELVEARRAVKTLEQLRKRQAEKFHREEESKQQKFLDEVAQRPFVGHATGKKIPH
jgi:flagellar export protein FliJ